MVGSGEQPLRITREGALELVKDGVVLIQVTQFAPQLLVYVDGSDRLRLREKLAP